MLTNMPMLLPELPGVELYCIPDPLVDAVGLVPEVYPALGVAPVLAGLGALVLRLAITGGVLVGTGFALSEFFGIASVDIVPSMVLGGVAATMFFSRDFFKEDSIAQPILAIGGIGAGIASMIVLFSGTAEAVTDEPPVIVPPPIVPPEQQIPDLPPGQLALFINAALDPTQPRTGGNTRSLFTEQEFEFSVRNDADRTLSFFVGLTVVDSDQVEVFNTAPLQRKLITLNSGEAKVERLSMPNASQFITLPQTMSVEVELYRNRDDAQNFRRSDAIPIKFSFIG